MPLPPQLRFSANRNWRDACRLAASILLLCLARVSTAQPVSVNSQPSADRDHHLFVGIDLFLATGNDQIKIRKLDGDNAVLDTPDRDRINLIQTPGLKWDLTTKVSAQIIQINDLKLVETTSMVHGEGLDRISNQIGLQIMADQNLDRAELSQREGILNMGDGDGPRGIRDVGQQTEDGAMLIDQALNLGESLSNAGVLGGATNDIDDPAPNTIQITFNVSSDQPIADAHAFGTAVIRVDEQLLDVIFSQQIGRITAKPRKITIMQPGLPPDFVIKQSTIHIFSQGEELATNHSDKHYELTAGEAEEFARLDHVSSLRNESAPARPAWPLAPPALHSSQRNEDFDYEIRVSLDEAGKLQSVDSGNQILPPEIREIVEGIVYLPAVENGRPVASDLVFNLADFFKE